MENFDKNDPIDGFFKDPLRAAGQGEKPDFGEWEKLAASLDNAPSNGLKKGSRKGWPNGWATGAALLVLALSNGWLFWKMRAVEQAAESLKTEVSEAKKAIAESRFDSVFSNEKGASVEPFLAEKSSEPSGNEKAETAEKAVFSIKKDLKRLDFEQKAAVQSPLLASPPTTNSAEDSNKKQIEKASEKQHSQVENASEKVVGGDANNGSLIPPFSAKKSDEKGQASPLVFEKTEAAATASRSEFGTGFPTEEMVEKTVEKSAEKSLEIDSVFSKIDLDAADSLAQKAEEKTPALDSVLAAIMPPVAEPVRRKKLRFSLAAGAAAMQPLASKNVFFSQQRGGFLAAEVRLSHRFSVGASVTVAAFEAKMDEKIDPRLWVEPFQMPSSEFVFKRFEGQQQLVLPEITASFRFFDSKKWSPRMTVGYGWRLLDTERGEFKFENPASGQDFETPEKHRRDFYSRGGQMSLRAGLDRRLGERFSAFGDAGATVDFGYGQRGFALGMGQLGLAFGF